MTFDQAYLPYIGTKNVDVLTFDNVKENDMMTFTGSIGVLNINTTTDFVSLSASMDSVSEINVTNNNVSGGHLNLYLNADDMSSVSVFKDLDNTEVYFNDKTDLTQPFVDKIGSAEIFCVNYGTSTFAYNRSQVVYPKAEICN